MHNFVCHQRNVLLWVSLHELVTYFLYCVQIHIALLVLVEPSYQDHHLVFGTLVHILFEAFRSESVL